MVDHNDRRPASLRAVLGFAPALATLELPQLQVTNPLRFGVHLRVWPELS